MFTTEIGISRLDNSYEAGKEAVRTAMEKLGEKPDLLFIMTTLEMKHQDVLNGIKYAAPDIPNVGCPADAIILREGLIDKTCVAVMAMKTRGCTLFIDHEVDITSHKKNSPGGLPEDSCKELAQRILDQIINDEENEKANYSLLLLSDNRLNSDIITFNLSNTLGPLCPIIGTAVNGWEMCGPFVNGKIMNRTTISVLIKSEEPNGIGVSHGWKNYGPTSAATKVDGSRIYELNGQPAFDEYRMLWGDKYPDVKGKTIEQMKQSFYPFATYHPLGIAQSRGEYLVRDPYQLNDDGSFYCGGTIPENSVVHIMTGNKEDLLNSSQAAARRALEKLNTKPGGILFFDCITRLSLPDFDISEEMRVIIDIIDDDVPILGMLSRGEIATPESGVALFHNKALAITMFSSNA